MPTSLIFAEGGLGSEVGLSAEGTLGAKGGPGVEGGSTTLPKVPMHLWQSCLNLVSNALLHLSTIGE